MTDELKATHIRDVWHEVRPALELLAKEQAADWRPEDFYSMCANRNASLYMAPDGFLILAPQVNEYTRRMEIEVLCAYFPSVDAQAKYLPQLFELAREIGADKFMMSTPRKGFERSQWQRVETRYQLIVPQEQDHAAIKT